MNPVEPGPWTIDDVERFELQSVFSQRTYEVGVALPASYGSASAHYSVLLILDPSLCFGAAVDTARTQAATRETAELILVGVGTPRREGMAAHALKRLRDFTPCVPPLAGSDSPVAHMLLQRIASAGLTPEDAFGGADAFLSFLTQELMPLLRARYRVDSTGVGLYGHSAGGVFATHALLKAGTGISRFITGSFPAEWVGPDAARREREYAVTAARPPIRLFHGVGGAEFEDPVMAPMVRSGGDMVDRLARTSMGCLTLVSRCFADETHSSVMLPLLASGIRWHWSTKLSFSQAAARPDRLGGTPR